MTCSVWNLENIFNLNDGICSGSFRFITYYFKTAFYFDAINSPRFNAIILDIMWLKIEKIWIQ